MDRFALVTAAVLSGAVPRVSVFYCIQ